MCSNTNSFRAVYETTSRLKFTASYRRKFDAGRLTVLTVIHKSNRRNANDAIRIFIMSVDLSSENTCTQVYSCSKCEQPVNECDRKQLGMSESEAIGKKRLSGVVIDSKVIALLKESGEATDEHDELHAVNGLSTRVVPTRDLQNAMKLFIKLVRSCIGMRRGARQNAGVDSSTKMGKDRFRVRNRKLYVRLGAIVYYCTTKGQMERMKVIEYIKIIRCYVDSTL